MHLQSTIILLNFDSPIIYNFNIHSTLVTLIAKLPFRFGRFNLKLRYKTLRFLFLMSAWEGGYPPGEADICLGGRMSAWWDGCPPGGTDVRLGRRISAWGGRCWQMSTWGGGHQPGGAELHAVARMSTPRDYLSQTEVVHEISIHFSMCPQISKSVRNIYACHQEPLKYLNCILQAAKTRWL